jgi:hypothetical protein
VRVRVPIGNFVVVNTACPLLKAADPSIVVPFLKVTLPVAPPGAAELTLAVSVADCPEVEGFGLEARVVVVEYKSTTCKTNALLGSNVLSPT